MTIGARMRRHLLHQSALELVEFGLSRTALRLTRAYDKRYEVRIMRRLRRLSVLHDRILMRAEGVTA